VFGATREVGFAYPLTAPEFLAALNRKEAIKKSLLMKPQW
jgi:hypothetical protein